MMAFWNDHSAISESPDVSDVVERAALAKSRLEAYIHQDNEDRDASRDWVPVVIVVPARAGCYLQYETTDINCLYIAGIKCSQPGRAPVLDFVWGHGDVACRAQPAQIEISMNSGLIHHIEISRHRSDALLGALIAAWRDNR